MSSTAYHNEALRKARVLERKQDAQTRMKQQYVNQSSLHVQPASTRNISHSQLNGPEMAEYRRRTVSDRPIRHRKMDNSPEDRIWNILVRKDVQFVTPADQLPPRIPHFKV